MLLPHLKFNIYESGSQFVKSYPKHSSNGNIAYKDWYVTQHVVILQPWKIPTMSPHSIWPRMITLSIKRHWHLTGRNLLKKLGKRAVLQFAVEQNKGVFYRREPHPLKKPSGFLGTSCDPLNSQIWGHEMGEVFPLLNWHLFWILSQRTGNPFREGCVWCVLFLGWKEFVYPSLPSSA